MNFDDIDDASTLSADLVSRLFETLSNYTRRCILRYLISNRDTTVTVDGLAKHVNASLHDFRNVSLTLEELKIDLLHNHLPRLDDLSVIDYDARTDQIRYWENELIEASLAAIPRRT